MISDTYEGESRIIAAIEGHSWTLCYSIQVRNVGSSICEREQVRFSDGGIQGVHFSSESLLHVS